MPQATLQTATGGLIDLHDIRKNQVAVALQELLERHHGDNLVLVPEGFELKSTEKWQAQRQRMSASFSFADLDEWAAYIEAQQLGEDQAICMIDHQRMSARATLDHGNTGESTEAEAMDAKQLAHAVRKITVDATRSVESQVSDFGANRSALEKIEARNKDRMPAFIFFKAKPYDDLAQRTFRLRVSVIASGDEPALVLRAIGLELEQRSMAQEFKGLVKAALNKTPVGVYVGT